jgi:hypothetical protein
VDLAQRGEDADAAVLEILKCCGDHRVSLVRARQGLAGRAEANPEVIARATEILDRALDAGTWRSSHRIHFGASSATVFVGLR